MDRDIVIAYLEGRLPQEKERELFSRISASDESLSEFREIEKEWKLLHPASPQALAMLDRIRKALTQSLREETSSGTRRKRWIRVGAFVSAAAAILLVCGLMFFPKVFSRKTPERIVIETPNGSNSQITLPDGTKVWLNAGTVLSYDGKFNQRQRNVDLQGEAYFEVARNERLPFIVSTRGCSLVVKGTQFDIQAYENNPQVQAVLMEGSLLFRAGEVTRLMRPNDLVSYDVASETVTQEQVHAHQYKAWIDGVITYDSITLPVLCNKLSKEFDVDIRLNTSAFNARIIRVAFQSGETVDTILEALEVILPISVVKTDGCYVVDAR